LVFERVQKRIVGYGNVSEADDGSAGHRVFVFSAAPNTAHGVRARFVEVGVQRAKRAGVADILKGLVHVSAVAALIAIA
jgi:hypothetical protein